MTITPEIYWNNTRDLLYSSPLPTTSGYTQQTQNIGEVSNKGYELTLNADLLRGKDYVLSANLTFGHNKMIVEKLNNTDDILWNQNSRWKSSYNDYCLRVGDEVGLIYGFIYDGLYSPSEFDFDPNQNFLAVPKEGTVVNNLAAGAAGAAVVAAGAEEPPEHATRLAAIAMDKMPAKIFLIVSVF